MTDYEAEIRNLKLSLKRLHIFAAVLLCTVVGLMLSGTRQVSVRADSVPDILTTKKLVIVDGAGNQRVVLGEVPLESAPFDPVDSTANVFGVSVFSPPIINQAAPAGPPTQPAHQLVFFGTGATRASTDVLPYVGVLRIISPDRQSGANVLVSPNDSNMHADGQARLFLFQNGQETSPHDQFVNTDSQVGLIVTGPRASVFTSDDYRNFNAGTITQSRSGVLVDINKVGLQNCPNSGTCGPLH